MKTDDVIRNLSNELKGGDNHFYRSSFLLWSLGTATLLVLLFHFIPMRHDLDIEFASPFFAVEVLLLCALFFVSTRLAYRSAVPGLIGRGEQFIGFLLIAVFAGLVLSKFSISGLKQELVLEMSFYRGRCGSILLVLAGLQTAIGIFVARRAAPTHLYRTGAWLGVSAGAMALVALQLICDHENFLHLLIWHAAPAMMIVAAGSVLGRRFLRW